MDTHFDCTQCGRCCHNLRLPLTIDEAVRWARNGHQVQLLIEAAPAFEEPATDSPERFRFDRAFPAMSGTIPIRVSVILVAAFEGACPHLLPDMRCGNYKARPRVCRIYPAEISPNVILTPESKACPPEAWSDDQPVLLRDGVLVHHELASLIAAQRSAMLSDVDAKAWTCLALGVASTAFMNEGYAVHSPAPKTLIDILLAAREKKAIRSDAQWSFVTNRKATLSMLEQVEARSSMTASGPDFIGFLEDDA